MSRWHRVKVQYERFGRRARPGRRLSSGAGTSAYAVCVSQVSADKLRQTLQSVVRDREFAQRSCNAMQASGQRQRAVNRLSRRRDRLK